jgi:hypothetical protein
MGKEGVMAIVATATALGVEPVLALTGGMWYLRGKVEISSRLMNSMIRAKKHSITKDPKSDDTICILHGRRADNGDTWTESFSIEEAKRANLMGNATWKTYPRDMLFARALSRLARQLYPDLIGNCYVEGETSESMEPKFDGLEVEVSSVISPDQVSRLNDEIGDNEELRQWLMSNLSSSCGITSLDDVPIPLYSKLMARLIKVRDSKEYLDPSKSA